MKVSTSKQFFRAALVLLLVVLAIFGLLFIVKQLSNRTNIESYISKSDSLMAVKLPDTVFVYNNNKSYTANRRFKTLSINLNSADTTELKKVYGIGSVFAKRIVDYRDKLGGYVSLEQLKEVRGVDNEKFVQISPNFFVDTLLIQKINLNFATEFRLTSHPYFSKSMVKRILKFKQLTDKSKDKQSKGGISNLQELIDNDILFPREAQKIAPYLTF